MATQSVKKTLEELQLKISQCALAEAQAKQKKAEVELETAKIHQAYVREMMERETRCALPRKKGDVQKQ